MEEGQWLHLLTKTFSSIQRIKGQVLVERRTSMTEKGCLKCGSKDAGTKEVAMTGTGLSKIFDVQHNTFIVVYCKKCGYSEFNNKQSSTSSNILGLFFGS